MNLYPTTKMNLYPMALKGKDYYRSVGKHDSEP